MSKHYETGDIKFVKAILRNSNKTVGTGIQGQLISLSIFEDIEQPTLYCELTMMDSINLIQDFPIIGEETLDISFYTPGREKPTKLTFSIYTVDGQSSAPTSKGSIYTLKGVSPVHFYNASSTVSKSYKTIVSDMVTDILKEMADHTGVVVRANIEPTKGLVPITIPRLTPFAAIDYLRQRSVSAENPSGGAYVFFMNQYGLHFKSVENLLKEGKKEVDSKKFIYSPDTKSDKERSAFAFRNIINFTHLSKFDSIDKLQSGHINTEVQHFDIFTKDTGSNNAKLSEKMSTFVSGDGKSRMSSSPMFIEKYNNNARSKFFIPKDSSRGDDFLDISLGVKNSYAALLNQNAVRVLVPGDNYLSVGEVVELSLPEVSGTTERKTKDRMNSGNYLITKLRHIITMEEGGKPKHMISMDCAKVGYK
jgi:hypothetical protein